MARPDANDPTPGMIRAEAERVLASADFAASRQLSRFLRFVVDESLAGRGDALTERAVARKALGRGPDYDPQFDCAVRVAAGKLRHALERYYHGPGADDRLRITLPKGGYRPVITSAGSSAKVLDGSSSSHDVTTTKSRFAHRPVVVVSPWIVADSSPSERNLGETFVTDVAARLTSFGWFETIPPLGLPAGAERMRPIELAARTKADFALSSVLRLDGDSARITVQLLRAADGVAVWGQQFFVDVGVANGDNDFVVAQIVGAVGDLFGALAEAAATLPAALRRALGSPLDALFRARTYLTHLREADFMPALSGGEAALGSHPTFALGWAAQAHLHLARLCFITDQGRGDASEQALECARRALAADPTCAYAHFVTGVHHLHHGRVDEAITAAERTLTHGTNSPYDVGAAGDLLSMAGDSVRGQAAIDRALTGNPRLPGFVHWGVAVNRLRYNDYRAALVATDLFSLPDCFWDWLLRAGALVRLGETREANTAALQAAAICPRLRSEPRKVIRKFVQSPDVCDDLVDCLLTAGAVSGGNHRQG